MSIAIVLDCSPEHESRRPYALQGLLRFLSDLEQRHPRDRICCVSYGGRSGPRLVAPLSRDFKADALEKAWGEGADGRDAKGASAETAENGGAVGALRLATEHVVAEMGSEAPCYIVLVELGVHAKGKGAEMGMDTTSASPARRKEGEKLSLAPAFSLHMVVFHDDSERGQEVSVPVANMNGGGLYRLPLPSSLPSLAETFDQITSHCKTTIPAVLAFGHLSTRVQIHPAPRPLPPADPHGKPCVLPSALSIVGYLRNDAVASVPYKSRHYVLLQPDCKHQESTFYYLLFESLRGQDKTALVRLRQDWFALASACMDPQDKKRSSLLLSILQPRIHAPWLGDLADLRVASAETEELEKEQQQMEIEEGEEVSHISFVSHIPLQPMTGKSYNWSKDDVLSVSEEQLQAQLTRYYRYLAKLPAKLETFMAQLNKLLATAKTYKLNGLVQVLATSLEEALSQHAADSAAHRNLAALAHQLRGEDEVPTTLTWT